ncbi:MAG TPA: arylesterase [Burkholderiales bacterium]|nr:arylesterase [Burkholderiales bacterium]
MLRIFLFLLLWSAAGVTHAAATIMVFGDSISAGYGLRQGTGWVDLLQRRLTSEKYDYKVINTSLSGETTLGGKNRIGRALAQHKPDIVILELGVNDGLRGASVEAIRANLAAMIADCRKRGAKVLLVGMQLPPNYGSDYTEKFRSAYSSIATSLRVPLVPFLLEGFAADPGAFLSDGVHPNASAQLRMLDTIWIQLRPMLSRAKR